jgi:ribonucleoside-diphosphate reductase beta chain
MDRNWYELPNEVRFGIRYLSAHFYPKRYMERWSVLKPLSVKLADQVKEYSPQQVQEELDHFQFFDLYFRDEPLSQIELPSSYIKFFDDLVEDFQSGELERIVTRFHLVTEGILATTGLDVLRRAGEKYSLPQFVTGIRHIIEDEARHINFGISLVTSKEYAVKRIEELYPQAKRIVEDGKEKLDHLVPFQEILEEMEELKRGRIYRLSKL